ncbi:MAG TPA: hypothetical protein VFI06_16715 [Chitinophagaceae bacterium]|nr:hypothetical protein [Chitinophagaceae bacterium]
MKKITSLLFASLIFQALQAQPYRQIRLKTGYSLLYPSPGGKGFAYKTVNGTSTSVVLGGEYSHPLKNGKGSWHVGFTFQDGYSFPTPNEKNLVPVNLAAPASQPGQISFYFFGSPAKTVVYGGFEWYLGRNHLNPRKNYFSVVAGVGLAFTLNRFEDWGYTSMPERYQTRNGGVVEGYSSNIIRPRFPLAPSVYGGIRYNVTNKKGNVVFIVELLVNYGLSSYYRQTIDYTLDGVAKRDILKEKGFCTQLNLIVPLYSFRKKKTKPLMLPPQR